MSWFDGFTPAQLPAQALLIDVRSYAEYMSGHVSGAISVPLPHFQTELVHKVPDRDTPLVVYCATGARSEQALGLLQQFGYKHAFNGGGAQDLAKRLHMPIAHGLQEQEP